VGSVSRGRADSCYKKTRPPTEAAYASVELYDPQFVQVNHDPVNLALVGMQQDDAATAAGIVHRMLARREHGRSLQDDADCRRGDYSGEYEWS
jgi:hypothetical protein